MSRSPFDRLENWNEAWIPQLSAVDTHFVTPAFHAFQSVDDDSTLFGYNLEDVGIRSGHFVRAWDPIDPAELQGKILKMACHLVVDLTPTAGLQEMLEKATEIRDYYCSLANWQKPAITEDTSVAVNPAVASYEREPFSYPEE